MPYAAKPSALRAPSGEDVSHRLANADEPKLEVQAPEPPEDLDERALEYWEYYVPILMEMRVLNKSHREALGALCTLKSLMLQAKEELKLGMFVQNDKGERRVNPAWRVVNQLALHIRSAESLFGLTPSTSTKLHAIPVKKQPGRWASLASRTNRRINNANASEGQSDGTGGS